MAKFSGTSGSLYLNVYIEPGAQNYANNTTVVNWRMTVSRTGAYYTYNENGDSTLSLDLNGGRVHTSNPRWRTSGEEFQMASGSTTVGHNADGTKSFGFSATFNPNNGLHGVITVSGNVTLQTIPRSSSISFGTGTIGSPLDITINRASSSFTHTLRWTWGNRSGTIASGLTTSASWTIPMDFCNEIPNNVSGTGTLFVDTYSGSSLIGTQSKQFTANVPDSAIPTLSSISVVEEHATARGLNLGPTTFIQIISNIKATINGAKGTYGSSINSTLIEMEGKGISSSSNPASFTNLNFNGAVKLKATVTDSRGRKSAVKELYINLLEYFAPAISVQAYRTREYPDKIQVLRTWKIAPLSVGGVQKNKAVLKFRAAPLNSSTFVDDAGTADATWTTQSSLTNSPANLSKTYATNKSWVVEGVLSDIFTDSLPSIAKSTVSTETAIYAYDKDGRFGVGKIPELGPAGSLDVAGDIFIAGKALRDILYPIGAIYQSTVNTDPSSFMGGTWERFGNGRVLVGVDEADSDFNAPNKTGGTKTHKLTAAEMAHSHFQTERFDSDYSIGNGHKFTIGESVASDTIKTSGVVDVTSQAHNNLQPYITVYMWRRTA